MDRRRLRSDLNRRWLTAYWKLGKRQLFKTGRRMEKLNLADRCEPAGRDRDPLARKGARTKLLYLLFWQVWGGSLVGGTKPIGGRKRPIENKPYSLGFRPCEQLIRLAGEVLGGQH